MQIAVASGKGGTGKTTVAVNLFHFIAKYTDSDVQLVDCDVEEPNTVLFFHDLIPVNTRKIYQNIPEINTETCTFCKKCSEWCAFNAITLVASRKFARVHVELCHSCGACIVACPNSAITEKSHFLGDITRYKTATGKCLTEGKLKIGSTMQTFLIKKLKEEICNNDSNIILDAPPGTSCQVVQTLLDSDYIVLVTEPTPFGLHDLTAVVEVIKLLNIPFGVIVNKSGLGSNNVYKYLQENAIELLGEIPFSKTFAHKYSKGNILSDISEETTSIYREIIAKIWTHQ